MRIAILSDIHGNLPALQAVLADVQANGAELICCLGDVVGYGPCPCECLDLITQKTDIIVMGNHDQAAIDPESHWPYMGYSAMIGMQYCLKKLSYSDLRIMARWPMSTYLGGLDIALAHGSFRPGVPWDYVVLPERKNAELACLPGALGFLGHTHMPFVYGSYFGVRDCLDDWLEIDDRESSLINVGSVGQPRDGDCRASYGLLEISDGGRKHFLLRRIPYDIAPVETAVIAAGLPLWVVERLRQAY